MAGMARIALLHPGAMGAAVGHALRDVGHDVGWLPEGRGAATVDRADAAGLAPWTDVAGVDVVISLVPPAAAVETATRVAGFTGVYVDANAISPDRSAEVAAIVRDGGATFVDGGVVGSPPTEAGTTRLYLSGAEASRIAALFDGSRVEAVTVEAGEFGASAVKMTYASWSKISAALVLAADRTAEAYGVADVLHAEWARSQPDLERRLERARSSALAKGWRWDDEMRQIAETFGAAGEPQGLGEAAAEIYGRYDRPE
ncbi:MAG: DUF1932 domain-containing protein [Pseudoclavibacter sp.]